MNLVYQMASMYFSFLCSSQDDLNQLEERYALIRSADSY